MFDVGFWELFLVLVISLFVVGPERLPEAVRSIRRWIMKMKRTVHNFQSEFEDMHSDKTSDLDARMENLQRLADQASVPTSSSAHTESSHKPKGG